MLSRGQKDLTLVLWFAPLSPTDGQDNVYGHIVNSSGGILPTQQRENIANLMQLIEAVGFGRLFFRFATQMGAHPFNWKTWNEEQYDQNWAFQTAVREIIYSSLNTSKVTLMFDLCLETGGIHVGEAQNYTLRMWKDYTSKYGATDTYGFTIPNPSPTEVTQAIQVYDQVGVRPPMYAFDIYGNEFEILSNVYLTLVKANEGKKPVLIQECYLNDVIAYTGFMQATMKYNIPVTGIFQWPLARSSNHTAFSVNYPPDYTAFLYGVSGTINASPNPCNISSSAPGSTCLSNISWQTANASSACIFLVAGDNSPKLFACDPATTAPAPWILPHLNYTFELRQTNDENSLLLGTVDVTGNLVA